MRSSKSRGQQIATVLHERRQQQHGVLNIGDGVGARILKGQHAAGCSVETAPRERPAAAATSLSASPRPPGLVPDWPCGRRRARPSSRRRRCRDGARAWKLRRRCGHFPAQMSEMHRQRDPGEAGGCGRSATSADGNFVFDVDAQGRDLAILGFEHLAISGDDEVVLHAGADLGVAAFGSDEEVGRPLSPQAKMEIQGQGSGVKSGAQIGGSRRQRQAQRAVLRCRT
jgi:hypothetical protein